VTLYKKLRSKIFNILGEYLEDTLAIQAAEDVMSEIVSSGLLEDNEERERPREISIPFNVFNIRWYRTNIPGSVDDAEEEIFNLAMEDQNAFTCCSLT